MTGRHAAALRNVCRCSQAPWEGEPVRGSCLVYPSPKLASVRICANPEFLWLAVLVPEPVVTGLG
jgi:hypothetical protein